MKGAALLCLWVSASTIIRILTMRRPRAMSTRTWRKSQAYALVFAMVGMGLLLWVFLMAGEGQR